MKRKSLSISLAAFAALLAGCEWGSSSGESSSWSDSYDSMNFGGTYRIATLAQTSSGSSSSSSSETTSSNAADWDTVKGEYGGTFGTGDKTAKGKAREQNIVPGSVQISCGDYVCPWITC